MAQTIRWSVDVTVDGGPAMSAAPSVRVDVYDKASIVVDAASGPTSPGEASIPLQSGSQDKIELMMITANRYDEALTYTLGGATIELDAPQLFTGGGMVSLFASNPETMEISNGLTTPVTVSVLVGRSAA
jgi:hypothetical protein